ncbi:BOLA class I histocompatibility antigen, alpha chain BL3-6-like [Clarias gariepinus]
MGSSLGLALHGLRVGLQGGDQVLGSSDVRDTHSYQYLFTGVTPGINFPEFTAVGMLDGEQINYYDSNIRKFINKTDWIKNAHADDPDVWDKYSQKLQIEQEEFKHEVKTLMQLFNHTEGVHTWQWMVGCNLTDNGSFYQFGYDGEDFISWDVKAETWTAAKPQAVITKLIWESDDFYKKQVNNYLKIECIDWLKMYVTYGNATLERRVRPEVSVFQKHSSSPEVVCHATGFFPKAVMITWQKDGEDEHEDVELRETLPNQDGSFQKRIILKVPAEELQKHNYTCVVQHSSLEKELVLNVSQCRILTGRARPAIIIIIIIIIAAMVFIAYCTRGQCR